MDIGNTFLITRDMEMVFATHNKNKLRELQEILAGCDIRILGLADIGCNEEIEENATTIEGNAMVKARYVKLHYGYDCFADDTGLMIDALDGAPGVYSARFAGDDCNSERNIDKVLQLMEGAKDRKARFVTVIALCKGEVETTFEGEVQGEILTCRRGAGGFGYDSIFEPEQCGLTFAEMSPEQKNGISHRGRAVKKLVAYLSGELAM